MLFYGSPVKLIILFRDVALDTCIHAPKCHKACVLMQLPNHVFKTLVCNYTHMKQRGVIFRQCMMTSSNGNIFRVTGHLCGEFTGHGEFPAQRPVTRSFDVFLDLRLNKRLGKQSWGWWSETLSCPLWRHCNGHNYFNGILAKHLLKVGHGYIT